MSDEQPERPIKNERVRFYLDNFQAIETWARLRGEANEELHDVLLDLADTLTRDAVDRGHDDVTVFADDVTNARRPRLVIVRRGWQDGDGRSPAAVVVEWHHPPIEKDGLHLYVGIRAGDRGGRDVSVGTYLSKVAPALRAQLGAPWQREAENFPVWRWITPEGDTIDEAALLDEARRAAWRCWDVAARHIDDAVRGTA